MGARRRAGGARAAPTLTGVLDLRAARLDDPDALALVDEVQRYYVELYGGEDEDPLSAEEFAPPRGGFLLGYEDGAAVAMGGWSRREAVPEEAKIRRMYVRPAGRRRGHAGALPDALEADAASSGVVRTVLTTGTPQADAVLFYRARGYADVEPFGHYAASPTAVHLGKPLTR